MIIGTPEGCVRAYDAEMMPEGERWDREAIAKMRGTPGRPNPNKAGTHIPTGVNVDEDDGDKAGADEHRANPREGEVRRMPMATEMFKKYGFAEGCEGCRAKRANVGPRRGHNEACRGRIMKEFK